MSAITLIVVDVDGTLCESRPVEGGFAAWEESVIEDHPEPHPTALREIPLLLARHPTARRVILTARHGRLRTVTRDFLTAHYWQTLGRLPLMMSCLAEGSYGGADDAAARMASRAHKLERLSNLRRMCPGYMLLVDDDAYMSAACGPRDTFVRAW